MESYKQKKLKELDYIFNHNPDRFYDNINEFISSLIDETEKQAYERGREDTIVEYEEEDAVCQRDIKIFEATKRNIIQQAQSEMREDLVKWANDELKINDAVRKNGTEEYALGKSKALNDLLIHLKHKTK